MLQGIVNKYFEGKKVLIILGMRNILIQLADYFKDSTFILSGKEFDETKSIHLATFQTYQRRKHNLEDYNLVAIDEAHLRYNTKIVKEIRTLKCTRLFMTGTPINNKNKALGRFDNVLNFIDIKQMIDKGYLAPTSFISRNNLLIHEKELGTQNGDYKDTDIERVMDKTSLLNTVVQDNIKYKWASEHKCICYVNTIRVGKQLCDSFNDINNVKIIHSNLSKVEYNEVMEWYDKASNGIIINCQILSIGFDSPTTNTIIYLFPTKIYSNYLQKIWRASTKYKDKHTTIYDYSGMLHKLSPYYTEWFKPNERKCSDQCKEFDKDSVEYECCVESCIDPNTFPICNGETSITFNMNPYKRNFKVMQGKPCGKVIQYGSIDLKQ
jgi:superfamily II DNA or RNA helicase